MKITGRQKIIGKENVRKECMGSKMANRFGRQQSYLGVFNTCARGGMRVWRVEDRAIEGWSEVE